MCTERQVTGECSSLDEDKPEEFVPPAVAVAVVAAAAVLAVKAEAAHGPAQEAYPPGS